MAGRNNSLVPKKTPASSTADSNEVVPETLRDVFRCFICMEKPQEAHLCPHCSKLCCYVCITRWLTEQRRQCPHCRATLNVNELVNCRWFEEVAHQVENLQQLCVNIKSNNLNASAEQDQCRVHQEKLTVYCWTCKCCICAQCALWGGTHSGHNFKKIELVYECHISQVKEEIGHLRERLVQLVNYIEVVELNVEIVREVKNKKVVEIHNAVELMIDRLDAQLKVKLMTLMRHKNFLSQESEQLERLMREIEHQINTCSRSQLIVKSPELLKMIFQVQIKSTNSYANTHVPPDFFSEIVPSYDTCSFVIEKFSKLQQDGMPVYSNSLHVNGLCWRLKVYPNGNGPARGEYLSVFLELTNGHPGSSKYDYRVQLLHENQNKKISREFVSDFEIGECWGYNRFFPLDLLSQEGYLNSQNDTLELRFQVRPSTYYQQCRDQQWFINQLLSTHQQQATQIKELQDALDREKKQNQLLAKLPPRLDAQSVSMSKLGSSSFRSVDEPSTSKTDRTVKKDDKPGSARRAKVSDENEKIFTEILKCFSPNWNTGPKKEVPPVQAQISSSSSSGSTNEESSPTANFSMDRSLLTASSDEDSSAQNLSGQHPKDKAVNPEPENGANVSAEPVDLFSFTSSDSDADEDICNNNLGASGDTNNNNVKKRISSMIEKLNQTLSGGEEEYYGETQTGENFVEYGEVSVAAETPSMQNLRNNDDDVLVASNSAQFSRELNDSAADDDMLLMSLLEDSPSSSKMERSLDISNLSSRRPVKAQRISFGQQPVRSTSVLETLLEPPRMSSSSLVTYFSQLGTNGDSSRSRHRSSSSSHRNGNSNSKLMNGSHHVKPIGNSFNENEHALMTRLANVTDVSPVSLNKPIAEESDSYNNMNDMLSLFCQTMGVPDSDSNNGAGTSNEAREHVPSPVTADNCCSTLDVLNPLAQRSKTIRINLCSSADRGRNCKEENGFVNMDGKMVVLGPSFRNHSYKIQRNSVDTGPSSSASFVSLPPTYSAGVRHNKRNLVPNTYKLDWTVNNRSFHSPSTSAINGRSTRYSQCAPNDINSESLDDEVLHHSTPNLSSNFFKGL